MAWDYFWGHVYEGIGFSMMGLWWLVNMLLDYTKGLAEGKPYITQLSYPVKIRGRSVPLEIIVKICFFVFFACVGPLWTHCRLVDDDGNFINLGVLTHSVTLSIFIIHSLADLADFLNWTSNKGLKFITASLAWGWCAMAFYVHSDADTGKSALERRLHRMLVPLMSITALVWLVETFRRDSVTIQAIRCYTLLAMGTWFVYISHVLYVPFPGTGSSLNPAWDVDNHKNVHFVTIAFAINLNVTLLIILGSFYIAESYQKCRQFFNKNGRRTDPNDNIDERMSLLGEEMPVNEEDNP